MLWQRVMPEEADEGLVVEVGEEMVVAKVLVTGGHHASHRRKVGGENMSEFLKKLVHKNIAGILGLIQTAIPVIRELLIVLTRICAIVIPGDKDDKIIAKISAGFKTFEAIFEKFKNFFL